MAVSAAASTSYAVFDAQAAYNFGRHTVEGSAVNLADRRTLEP